MIGAQYDQVLGFPVVVGEHDLWRLSCSSVRDKMIAICTGQVKVYRSKKAQRRPGRSTFLYQYLLSVLIDKLSKVKSPSEGNERATPAPRKESR